MVHWASLGGIGAESADVTAAAPPRIGAGAGAADAVSTGLGRLLRSTPGATSIGSRYALAGGLFSVQLIPHSPTRTGATTFKNDIQRVERHMRRILTIHARDDESNGAGSEIAD